MSGGNRYKLTDRLIFAILAAHPVSGEFSGKTEYAPTKGQAIIQESRVQIPHGPATVIRLWVFSQNAESVLHTLTMNGHVPVFVPAAEGFSAAGF